MYRVLTPEGNIKTREYQVGLKEPDLIKLYRGMLRVRVINKKLQPTASGKNRVLRGLYRTGNGRSR